ncbi:5-formyltetrahydrofolate cyclo-ligase [Bifidobacterium parmae]|uniref:5-formyltetrahydrofolate cyclo-ligase n=1 Tax=Bifidobacterium parmae TaxID=361854 RepID=A0A2N5IW21_9BIFI|nr:5-formyltetrahydrofolate cyclo-ligase [Bifidobacterium parmae]PLS26159.1 5-formyltetrahydrofolate cyclo-ligase [Bifidobacterium parmae]
MTDDHDDHVDEAAADATAPDADRVVRKRRLRHEAIARRKAVPAGERAEAGARLAARMRDLPWPADVRETLTGDDDDEDGTAAPALDGVTVAAYVSMGSEVELRPLLAAMLDAGARVLVPLLGSGLEVGWGELRGLADLHAMDAPGPGRLRPDEPQVATLPPEALGEASLVVVPTLAVDRSGTRLGRGGGWYDRALEHRAPDAPVVAVCWPWELLDADAEPLPREPHDLPVDGALTPDGVTMFV